MGRPGDCTCPETKRIAYEWDMTHDKNIVKEEDKNKVKEPFKL